MNTLCWIFVVLADWFCLTPIQQFFSYIMLRTSYISTRWCLLKCSTRPTHLAGFL